MTETLHDIVDRLWHPDPYAGRVYRYGSRLLVEHGWVEIVVTVRGCGDEDGIAVLDAVTQSGEKVWKFDSQIVRVLAW